MKIEVKGYVVGSDDKEIYDFFGISAIAPSDISSAIGDANGEPLDVEIGTCYGGEIYAGSEIYSALKAYKGGVNITITGLAASAASVIAMAGHCEMAPTAMMMVHNVSSYAEGDYHAMDKQSDTLKQANKAMAGAYTAKSGMSESDALAMMNKETWLTAQQALDKGLIDKVMFSDSSQLVAAYSNGMLPRSVIEKTRNSLHPAKPEPIEPPAIPENTADKNKILLEIDLI